MSNSIWSQQPFSYDKVFPIKTAALVISDTLYVLHYNTNVAHFSKKENSYKCKGVIHKPCEKFLDIFYHPSPFVAHFTITPIPLLMKSFVNSSLWCINKQILCYCRRRYRLDIDCLIYPHCSTARKYLRMYTIFNVSFQHLLIRTVK